MAHSGLESYIEESVAQFGGISGERKERLQELARFVEEQAKNDATSQLTFICTHNSRRSHLSRIWAQTAAAWYAVPKVATYSGGTEATAFNPRAVAALERAGFAIEKVSEGSNPTYSVSSLDGVESMRACSRVYNEQPNPGRDFCAVMTCSDADRNCPAVMGATFRIAIPYEDPKAHDGTDREAAAYDECCRRISREMLYFFSLVQV